MKDERPALLLTTLTRSVIKMELPDSVSDPHCDVLLPSSSIPVLGLFHVLCWLKHSGHASFPLFLHSNMSLIITLETGLARRRTFGSFIRVIGARKLGAHFVLKTLVGFPSMATTTALWFFVCYVDNILGARYCFFLLLFVNSWQFT